MFSKKSHGKKNKSSRGKNPYVYKREFMFFMLPFSGSWAF